MKINNDESEKSFDHQFIYGVSDQAADGICHNIQCFHRPSQAHRIL